MTEASAIESSLARVRVVLCSPTSPGNIGACARAMRVMGLHDLALVNPADHLCKDAIARSARNEELLRSATVAETLAEVVADCSLVLGASGRARLHESPPLSARQAGERTAAAPLDQRIAVVFGTERAGLTNDELAHCDARLLIPTAPDYRSLNLGAAVQLICYELRMGHLARDAASPEPSAAPATRAELEGFYDHLKQALVAVGYTDPLNPAHAHSLERVRQIYQRANLTQEEVHLLRGVQARTLAAVERGEP